MHDLDTKGVIGLIPRMRDDGVRPSGREIEPAPSFFIGAADTPHDPAPNQSMESVARVIDEAGLRRAVGRIEQFPPRWNRTGPGRGALVTNDNLPIGSGGAKERHT